MLKKLIHKFFPPKTQPVLPALISQDGVLVYEVHFVPNQDQNFYVVGEERSIAEIGFNENPTISVRLTK